MDIKEAVDVNETQTNNVSSGKGGKIALIIAIIVIVALIGIIGFLLLRKEKPQDQPQEASREVLRDVVTPENVDNILEEMANYEVVEPGYYAVTQNSEWHFADGSSVSSDAYVENIAENTNDVYFDVFLAGDEEHAIYESPVIPRGAVLDQITLNEDLEPGTYDCIMIYHLVDENQNTLDTLHVTVVIIVEG